MLQIDYEPKLTFDDVLIEPGFSSINSRDDIDISQNLWGLDFGIPIISSNMDYITEAEMAIAMSELGGFGILHRFKDWEEQFMDIIDTWNSTAPTIISVGIRDIETSMWRIKDSLDYLSGVCIDVAHGHHQKVYDLVARIKTEFPDLKVIAGNVATQEGYSFLAKAGADAIKVGIGPGSVCTTRTVTGAGVPQLHAIMEANFARDLDPNVKIIADGGIKSSGDIVKALAAGADFVMLGHLLAGTKETPGEAVVGPQGRRYKPYRGQSIFGSNALRETPEGISGWVEEKGSVSYVIKQLVGGIKSGMSYVGAQNLQELREKAKFITISGSTQTENGTRVKESI